MKKTHNSLSFFQAQLMCQNFQHLRDQMIINEEMQFHQIIDVVVAPYDSYNKMVFVGNYKDGQNAAAALDFYKVSYYDVVIIMREISFDESEPVIRYKELRKYLDDVNISYESDMIEDSPLMAAPVFMGRNVA